ncbi:unnamed protein product [Porites evermanni]|uniref:Uncharacterized protein n=1 Tax=Porites evermanni TaxID=104178 RepID=A0ABN8SZ77_9CNID|nr:unnamed protein product [Porites evermanni]
MKKVSVCGFDPYLKKISGYRKLLSLANLVGENKPNEGPQVDGYFLVSGWVNTLYMRCVGTDKVVVFARVSEDNLKFFVPCFDIFTACCVMLRFSLSLKIYLDKHCKISAVRLQLESSHKVQFGTSKGQVVLTKSICYPEAHKFSTAATRWVQAQIFICGVEYCDFVVWTTQDIFVQRILPDRELRANSLRAPTEFFSKFLLPEMVGILSVIHVQVVKFKPTLIHHHQHVMKTTWKGLGATVSDMWKKAH